MAQQQELVRRGRQRIDTSIDNIQVCNLSDDGAELGAFAGSHDKISIDPVLGRIAFPPGTPPKNVRVTFHYGFSMAMGGGEYERRKKFSLDWQRHHCCDARQSLQSALRRCDWRWHRRDRRQRALRGDAVDCRRC